MDATNESEIVRPSEENEENDGDNGDDSDNDSDDEVREEEEFYESVDIVLAGAYSVLCAATKVIDATRHQQIEYPLSRRPITRFGHEFIQRVLNDDQENFRQMYRMCPDAFRRLCSIIREKTPLQDTRYICVEEMLATFLLIVDQNSRYCTIRETFGRSRWSISNNFHRILTALNTIAPQMMAKPATTTPAKIKDSTRYYPYFKDCIGAMNGTHIPAMVLEREQCVYRNRHGITSQNVLAVCNFDLEFIYVLSGWEGSAHDSKVLNDALTRRNGLKVQEGKYYLVDCGFPNRRQFLAPYRGVRYHLQDFSGEGCHPEKAVELFNLRHSSLRNVVERIFGVFKSRFAIFKSAPPFPFKTQAEVVLACAGLHNFLRKEFRTDEFPPEDEDRPYSVPLPVYNDEIDTGSVYLSQQRQREEANEWRDSLCNRMWADAERQREEA